MGYEKTEVLRLLGVKPHVLRYWEQSLPLVRPGRGDGGRRVWSAAQVRMLLRVRHMVVERGMSVAAAGKALVTEAGYETADGKARLEALRARLITLLLRNRAESEMLPSRQPRNEDSARIQSIDPLRAATGPTLSIESLIDLGAVPTRRKTSESKSWPDDFVTDPDPWTSAPVSLAVVPLSHLQVPLNPREQAETVAQVLNWRGYEDAEIPVIIPAPAELEREFLTTSLSKRANTFLLFLPGLELRGRRWHSPVFSLLVTLASSSPLDQWLSQRKAEYLYLLAPDDRNLPSLPSSASVGRQTGARLDGESVTDPNGGLVVGADAHRPARVRTATIHLSTWRSTWRSHVAQGAWSFEPIEEYWRYDLSLQNLRAPRVTVPVPTYPVPWRSSAWPREVRALWGGRW